MPPPTTVLNNSGQISVIAEANGLLLTVPPNIANPRLFVGFFITTGTSVVVAIKGRLKGLVNFYPMACRRRSTGLPVASDSISLANNTTGDGYEVDLTGCDQVEIFVVSGTLTTPLNVEEGVAPASKDAMPLIIGTSAGASSFGAGLTFTGGSGANTLSIPDNLAVAWQLTEGANPYLTAITTDAAERLTTPKQFIVMSATATPAGGTTGAGLAFGTTANFGIFYGSGLPTLTAAQGSIYLRSDGSSTSTRLYVNTTGSTVWTNFTSAA